MHIKALFKVFSNIAKSQLFIVIIITCVYLYFSITIIHCETNDEGMDKFGKASINNSNLWGVLINSNINTLTLNIELNTKALAKLGIGIGMALIIPGGMISIAISIQYSNVHIISKICSVILGGIIPCLIFIYFYK